MTTQSKSYWKRWYTLVLLALAAQIAFYCWFTVHYR